MIAKVPMDRWGEPAELATAVLYFASEASGFTTGRPWSSMAGTPLSSAV